MGKPVEKVSPLTLSPEKSDNLPLKLNPILSELNLRRHLQKMCSLSLLVNQIEGLVPFTLDRQNRYHISPCSFPLVSLIFQFFTQLLYVVWYFLATKDITSKADLLHDLSTSALAFLVLTGCQTCIRMTYAILHKRITNFHNKLTKITCNLCLSELHYCPPDLVLKWINEITLSLDRICKISCLFGIIFVGGWVVLGSISADSLVVSKDLASFLNLIFVAFSVANFCMITVVYTFVSVWFVLYIKWMTMGFRLVSLNSANFINDIFSVSATEECDTQQGRRDDQRILLKETLHKFVNQFGQLEKIVQEFNFLFQVPIIVWLFSIGTITITELFFILTSLKQGMYLNSVPLLIFVLLISANVYILSDAGSTFIWDVRYS